MNWLGTSTNTPNKTGALYLMDNATFHNTFWIQASRLMLAWDEILNVVRAAQKKDRDKPIAHYFGYRSVIETKGTARDKRLIKLIRYVEQEGECTGCGTEFRFDDLTLDRILPGKANGVYELPNVQLMCEPCNNRKGDKYGDQLMGSRPDASSSR